MDPQTVATQGYGVALLQTLLALAGVCVLAWWLLRWGMRGGMLGATGGGRIEVMERALLDARRAVYLVRIGKRVLVVGAGEGGLTLLAEMQESELPEVKGREASGGLREMMARLRGSGSRGVGKGGEA